MSPSDALPLDRRGSGRRLEISNIYASSRNCTKVPQRQWTKQHSTILRTVSGVKEFGRSFFDCCPNVVTNITHILCFTFIYLVHIWYIMFIYLYSSLVKRKSLAIHVRSKLFSLLHLKRYKTHLQWTDGTVAYMYHIDARQISKLHVETCSMIDFSTSKIFTSKQQSTFPLRLTKCNTVLTVPYVCERRLTQEKHSQIQIPLTVPNEHVRFESYSVCPSGHVTHKLLSCDPQSACWARHTLSVFICKSPLRPVPPTFTCSSQMDRVPYPLVCDHRPDCRDHSDESFCVFPGCPAESFHCGSKQVITSKLHELCL